MAQNGGKREGAGKPKGYRAPHTLEAQESRKRLITRVTARADELIDKLFEKALEDKGDTIAIKELLDRAYGKPQQSMEVTNPDGNLKTIIIQKANENINDKSTA